MSATVDLVEVGETGINRLDPTAGRSDRTSGRGETGAEAPEAMKAARPPVLTTAKERVATSPPTVSNTASHLLTALVKSVAR